ATSWSSSASPMRSKRPRTGCSAARRKKSRRKAGFSREPSRLHLAADYVGADAIFGVRIGITPRGKRGVGAGFQRAHAAGVADSLVHLRVDRDGDLVRQVRRAQDEAGEELTARFAENSRRGRAGAIARLHAHLAGDGIERVIRAGATDEARAAQLVPEL